MNIETIRTYDLLAREYDQETHDFWDEFPGDFLNRFTNNIGSKSWVLDHGSGPGRGGLKIKHSDLKVVGLDASSSMVRLSDCLGLETVQADFLNLPFKKNSFRGVWAYTSLLHVEKYLISHALAEINRVMATCAVLGLGMIEGNSEETRLSLGHRPRHFSYYQLEELNTLLKESGFAPFYQRSFKPKSRNFLNILAVKL